MQLRLSPVHSIVHLYEAQARFLFSSTELHHRRHGSCISGTRWLAGGRVCLFCSVCLRTFGDRPTAIIKYPPIPLSPHLSVPYEYLTTLTFIPRSRRYLQATAQNEFWSPRRRISQLQTHTVSLRRLDLYPASERRCASRCVSTT